MKKKSLFKFFAIIVCFVICFLIFFDRSSYLVIKVGKSKYQSKIMAFSYDAIDYAITDKDKLNDLILIEKDSSNNISFISTNTYKVNQIALEIAKNFKNRVQKDFDKGLYIPLGAFTGIDFFSGYGKKVNVKLVTITSVKCEFISDFIEMGINQTRHILKINVQTNAEIICQYKSKRVESNISVYLFDNLIVGKVPNAYLNGKILGSATT